MATAARLNDLDFSTVASLVDAINEDPQNAATVWQADVRWRGGFRSEARSAGSSRCRPTSRRASPAATPRRTRWSRSRRRSATAWRSATSRS